MTAAGGSTIAAIASARGAGVRGVIRVSGPRAADVLRACARDAEGRPPEPAGRGAFELRFYDGVGSLPALALWMPGPRSFTAARTSSSCTCPARRGSCAAPSSAFWRAASPRRGRASSRGARSRAGASTCLGPRACSHWCARATRRRPAPRPPSSGAGWPSASPSFATDSRSCARLCEASLDFDEADTGHVPLEELVAVGAAALRGLDGALEWEERREPLGDLPRVVLAGPANAGKSSLFNRLAGARALVSDLAGTTRDTLRAVVHLDGGDVLLVDTAGVESGAPRDALASAAALRAQEARAAGELVLWVVDASAADASAARTDAPLPPGGGAWIAVRNQVDRPGVARAPRPPPRARARRSRPAR